MAADAVVAVKAKALAPIRMAALNVFMVRLRFGSSPNALHGRWLQDSPWRRTAISCLPHSLMYWGDSGAPAQHHHCHRRPATASCTAKTATRDKPSAARLQILRAFGVWALR